MKFIEPLVVVLLVFAVLAGAYLEHSKYITRQSNECAVEMVVAKGFRFDHFNTAFLGFADFLVIKSGGYKWEVPPDNPAEQRFIQSLDEDFRGWIRICPGGPYYESSFRHLF